jgi:hypothetical protein
MTFQRINDNLHRAHDGKHMHVGSNPSLLKLRHSLHFDKHLTVVLDSVILAKQAPTPHENNAIPSPASAHQHNSISSHNHTNRMHETHKPPNKTQNIIPTRPSSLLTENWHIHFIIIIDSRFFQQKPYYRNFLTLERTMFPLPNSSKTACWLPPNLHVAEEEDPVHA